MTEITYRVEDLKTLIRESSQEFRAKMGTNVEKTNKENSKESYADSKKRAEDFDGGIPKANKETLTKVDDNKTTMDYTFDYEPPKSYTDRVQAQAKGFTSELDEDNDTERNGDFDGNKAILDAWEEANAINNDNKFIAKKTGLTAQNMPDKTFKKSTMFEEHKNIPRLNFKHTKFLSEAHMNSRIPEDYKVHGQKFIMKDMEDNEFLVEWTVNEKTNISEANILSHTNKTQIKEELNKIKSLFNDPNPKFYKNTTTSSRLNEERMFEELLEKSRKLTNI